MSFEFERVFEGPEQETEQETEHESAGVVSYTPNEIHDSGEDNVSPYLWSRVFESLPQHPVENEDTDTSSSRSMYVLSIDEICETGSGIRISYTDMDHTQKALICLEITSILPVPEMENPQIGRRRLIDYARDMPYRKHRIFR